MAHTLNYADKTALIHYLKDFYSLPQLEIIYCTLTDQGVIPGMSDFERTARTEAIAQILKVAKTDAPMPISQSLIEPTPENRIPLAKAQRLARGLVERLEEYCDRIHIAGSIRRQKAEVKDIEIVCQPKTFIEADFSLFGSGSQDVKVIPAFAREVETLGLNVIKGKPDGRYMQIEAFKGIKLDLFMPQAHDFFRQFSIRTGSAEYAAKVIARGWKNLGWCGTPDGLRRMSQCEETKSGWKCHAEKPILPPVFESEEHFFDFIKVKWVPPELRNV